MEWGGLLIQALMLGGFLCWEGFLKQKGKNLAIKDDARDISYEQEKGKNLATQDDIVKITNMVESVSNEISVQKQRETEYLYKRNECMIEFLNILDELDLYRMKVSRISNTLGNPEVSQQYLLDLECFILKFSKQYRLLTIYNPNKESSQAILDVYNTTNNFSNYLYATIFSFYHINIQYTKLVENYNKNTKEQIEELRRETKELIDRYDKDSDELYKKYMSSLNGYNAYLELFFDAKLHLKANISVKAEQ